MVTLPKQFVATRYPGYFWDTDTKRLFSLKQGGELAVLRLYPAIRIRGGMYFPARYQISVNGYRKSYPVSLLYGLKATSEIQEIGIRK